MGERAHAVPSAELPQCLVYSQTTDQVARVRQIENRLGNERRGQRRSILRRTPGGGAMGIQQSGQWHQRNDRSQQLQLWAQRPKRLLQMREQLTLKDVAELQKSFASGKLPMGFAAPVVFLFGDNILPRNQPLLQTHLLLSASSIPFPHPASLNLTGLVLQAARVNGRLQ